MKSSALNAELQRRHIAEQALQAIIHEKDALLRQKDEEIVEVQRRVTNNLLLLQSLMRIQVTRSTNASAMKQLKEISDRVRALGMLHEILWQSGRHASLNAAEYLRSIIVHLHRSSETDKPVRVQCDIDPVELDVEVMTPIGLIINELVANALEHAFPPGREYAQRTIHVMLQADEGTLEIAVSDTGAGLPEGFDPQSSRTTGMQIIRSLVSQLDGQLRFESAEGTRFVIRFPYCP